MYRQVIPALLTTLVGVFGCNSDNVSGAPADLSIDASGLDFAAVGPPPDLAGGMDLGSITLPTLSFAIVGNTRPPTPDDIAGYPVSIISRIWQDIEAASPRPAFAVATGGYMFASPNGTSSTASAQLTDYIMARKTFTNVLYPAMGYLECDGTRVDNCSATCAKGTCQTPNLTAFMSMLLAPISESLPYYTVHFNGINNAWTAKFVFVACNAWSATQATWLGNELSVPTTYTFVVRNARIAATSAPCLSDPNNNAGTIMAQHPYTLLIDGEIGTYLYSAAEKEVTVGIGGAPLATQIDYGYVIARQQPDGTMAFTEYDYMTNAANSSFTVNP